MIHSIATRKITAFLSAIAWLALVVQGTSYGQPPVAEGKMYWTALESGIYRSSLDGTNIEQLVKPEWSYPGDIALDLLGGKMYWTDRRVSGGIYRSALDGTNVETLLGNNWIETPLGNESIQLLGFHSWVTSIALDVVGDKMYWTEVFNHGDYHDAIIARANLDGSNFEPLAEIRSPWGIALDLSGGKMYWTEGGDERIFRADLNGQNIDYDYIRTGPGYPQGLALDVDGGKIYWTDWTDAGAIQRADLDGQNIEEVLTVSDGYPREIALDVDGGKIYWTNPSAQTIQRADLNGQNIEHLFHLADDIKRHLFGPRTSIALDVNRGKIYWTDSGPGTIQRADLDGENREVLFDPVVREPYGIALYLDKMYWTDVVKGTVQRADLNGENIEVLITDLDRPKDIALLDWDKIYWAAEGAGKFRAEPEIGRIQAADLDGSNVEEIVTGLDRPKAIVLDEGRSKIYWTEEATIQRSNLDGSQVEEIATGRSLGIALDQDKSKIYWTNRDTVFHSNLDGSHIENIAIVHRWEGGNAAIALDPIGGKIYWTGLRVGFNTDWHSPSPVYSEIFRSNLDGSNVEEIRSMGIGGRSFPSGIALDLSHPTSISTPDTTPALPTTSGLSPNFPNPFNASTQIAYDIASPGPVRLTIYNTLGQPVHTLVNQSQPAGSYQVRWNARDQRGTALAAGVYLVHLHYPSGEQTRRLLLLK